MMIAVEGKNQSLEKENKEMSESLRNTLAEKENYRKLYENSKN